MDKFMIKSVTILLCVCILACQNPIVFADSDWIGISSVEEFLAFAENCRLDSFSQGKSFRLTADLDLSGTDFDGIPIFCGTLDGNFHTISGLRMDSAGSVMGLFRYLQPTATVRDLTVEGVVSPAGSRAQVGGIAGSNAGVVENCTFLGQVSGAENVGAIVGLNLEGGVVRGCTAYGTVSGKHFVGGIVGSNHGLLENCVNRADVNATAQQNDTDISDITMDSLLNAESPVTATDIGGIAGFSDGHILRCKNWAAVGYRHMGYNVGGIAGMQAGYIADCENYGAVFGRKEVGGIAGQQEPEVRLHYSTDTVQILREQTAVLSDLIHRASDNAEINSAKINNLIQELENHGNTIEKTIEKIEKVAENPQIEDLQTILDALSTIQSSLDSLDKTLDSLWDAIDKTATDLTADMDAISGQMAVIENTLDHAEDGIGGEFFDISDQDTPEELGSKVENCRNYGSILADLNAGGIIGAVAFENDLDPEADITVEGDMTLNAAGSVRSVILSCANFGAVNAKTMRIGGIVGRLSLGLVKECVNTGLLDNPTADYVGGIAGESEGFIRACLVKCGLSGDMYVGGIAGTGRIATNCQSMVSLNGTERIGAILGLLNDARTEIEEAVKDNLYLRTDKDIGAIDGISYSGMAQGLDLAEFLQLQPEESIFRTVTITFVADGTVVHKAELPTGSACTEIPAVPPKDGATGSWASIGDLDLKCMLFDVTIVANYVSHQTVIQSDLTSQNGRPILLLQGDFAVGATVTLSKLESLPTLQEGMQFVEGWEFVTEHCLSQQAGRLLLPDKVDAENLAVMVRDADGNWSRRTHHIDGSYVVFPLSHGENSVALVQIPAERISAKTVILLAGLGVLAVGGIVLACVSISRRKRRNAAKTEETKE